MTVGHILILGGARSGKTALAEKTCLKLGSNPAYIATAEPLKHEMSQRILKHKQQRSKKFTTYEEPLALAQTIEKTAKNHDVVLVDCLTLWLTNLMLSKSADKNASIDQLKTTLITTKNRTIVLVSNEVGMGIIPDNALARQFGDDAGLLHQQLADICENVCLVVAGLPLILKGELPNLGQSQQPGKN